MSWTKDCTIECEAAPTCTTCRRRKKPIGRDAPLASANSLCGSQCPSYHLPPFPGHLWPGELKRAAEDAEPEERVEYDGETPREGAERDYKQNHGR